MSEFKDGSRQPRAATTPIGLRELLDGAPDLVFACDATGRFEWLNSSIERLLGFKTSDLLNHPFATLLAPATRVSSIRAFRRMALRKSPEFQRVVNLVTQGAQPIMLDVRVSRRERMDGEISFVGIARPWRGLPGEKEAAPVPMAAAPGNGELAKLRAELNAARQEKTDLKAQIAKAQQDVSNLTAQLAKAQIAKAEQGSSNLTAQIAKARDEGGKPGAPPAKDAATADPAQLAKAREENASLTQQLAKAREENASLTQQISKAREDGAGVAAQLGKAREESAGVAAQLTKAREEGTIGAAQLTRVRDEGASLNAQLTKAREEIASLGAQLANARAEATSASAQQAKSRDEGSNLNAQLAKANEETASLEAELSKTQVAMAALKADAEMKAAELRDAQQKVAEERRSADAARTRAHDDDTTTHAHALAEIKSDLARRDEEIQTLKAEVRRASAELDAERRAVDEARAAARAREAAAHSATSTAAAGANAKLADLQARHDELKSRNAELESRATDPDGRSADVGKLNAQLDEARAMVQLKSEFLATMSQEIRAPMTGIMGMTNLLLESELDADQRSMVEVAQSSGRALLNLINDTIDFSRLDSDRLEIEKLGFDLRVTVDEVAQLLAPLANEKSLHFDCRVHHEVPSRLIGDPGRLRQVLLNLGVCAIRTTEKNEVTMRIERAGENDERVSVRFSVSDSCAGSTPPFVLKLYRCFADDDLGLARRMGGAGLSLAVSRQLVMRMGGTIGLERRAGLGNTLWFQVPLDKQGEEPKSVMAPNVQLRGLRVLVVDPSRAARDAMVEMLTAWGCRAEALDQAEAALVRLRKAAGQGDPYSVAIIEMQLQGSSGEELGHAVRSDEVLKQTRTLLTTSLGRKGDAQRAQAMGFSAYLMKPLQWSELYEALVEVLGQAEPAQEASASLVTRHSLAEARRGRVRVLLAEDNAVNQLVAEWALRRLGYTIELVPSAAAAIEASERGHFDLILMDIQLPDMDGCKAAAAIRARERGRKTPIIGMSGHATDGDRSRCLESGMQECIRKPIDLGQLCSLVEEFTRGRKEGGSVGGANSVVAMIDRTMDWSKPGTTAEDDADAAAIPEIPVVEDAPSGPPSGEFPRLKLVGVDGEPVEDGRWSATSHASREAQKGDGNTPLVPIDTARLEESCMGIPALRDALLQTFRADIGPRLTRLAEAIVQADPRLVEFEAHGLKGMSATIGATSCEAAFEEIERLGRDEDLRNASRLLQSAQGTVERTEQFITRLEKILQQANEAA